MADTRISCDVCLGDESRPRFVNFTSDGRAYFRELSDGGNLHLFATRKGLQELSQAISVALREMDIREGLFMPHDDGLDPTQQPVPKTAG